jgi:hypothetical protein
MVAPTSNSVIIQNGVRITNGVIIRNGNGAPTIYYVVTEDLLENIQTEDGFDVITENSQSSGVQGDNGNILYQDMNPPIIPGMQLEDGSATINGSTGFTINNDFATGIAVMNLSSSNQTFFNNLGLGIHTVTFGSGSTVASATVEIVNLPNGQGGGGPGGLVFFIQGQSGPATYNYPFTFS